MQAKETKCPWCDEVIQPKEVTTEGKHGKIQELRCPKCDGIIKARLKDLPPI
ncbi:MAG TPA: hypothetical protein G4O03_07170 [Dehalococcoidia bacterium]|nr:hypothetical protein [Dehalococcoidia bacterium]